MALTRKFLAALGIEADKIDEIIDAHTESINALKEQRDQYKGDAEKLASVQQELDKLKETSDDGFEQKYKDAKKELEDFKAEVAAKELQAKKETAYREVLKDANLSEEGIKKALKYAEWDKIDLDENSKVKDSKAHIKTAQDEWSAYVVTTSTKGANTPNPPTGTGKTYSSKEEIMKIADAGERQRAIAENHELFGF